MRSFSSATSEVRTPWRSLDLAQPLLRAVKALLEVGARDSGAAQAGAENRNCGSDATYIRGGRHGPPRSVAQGRLRPQHLNGACNQPCFAPEALPPAPGRNPPTHARWREL